MVGRIKRYFQKRREAEQEARSRRNRKIGRHHPGHLIEDAVEAVSDIVEAAIKWD